jgi:hypothetical protein
LEAMNELHELVNKADPLTFIHNKPETWPGSFRLRLPRNIQSNCGCERDRLGRSTP